MVAIFLLRVVSSRHESIPPLTNSDVMLKCGISTSNFCLLFPRHGYPDSKVHGANMGPTWVLSAPDGPHIGPTNLAIRVITPSTHKLCEEWSLNLATHRNTEHPRDYAILCTLLGFVVVWVSVTCILQGYFTGSRAIIWFSKCNWSNHEEFG